MSQDFLMGNQAIGIAALHAGVNIVCGYPGTPSTEILETIAKKSDNNTYVEWSVNEKAALEVAAGASYSGARTIVTMKQVGLNVAVDPLMSLAYIGIKGGMVIVVADDPGPISSQTEQDTRAFASFCKLPIFDPSTPQEAYNMVLKAFEYSEKYSTPVLFRPTTRVCHGYAQITFTDKPYTNTIDGFEKKPEWVIFPKLSYMCHQKIVNRNPIIGDDFSASDLNSVSGHGEVAIVTGGISYVYTKEALQSLNLDYSLLKIGTPYPFPEKYALDFMKDKKTILVIEELDPVIERELIYLCGKHKLDINILGKISGNVQTAGENSVESVKNAISSLFNENTTDVANIKLPKLPVRPPVLCAGCPHRASFYAVKVAAKGHKAIFSGDIGCYTLGNAAPLDMVDTCLCMGAGITIAQGIKRACKDTVNFAFIGDSTFFASGMTGIVNAVYNKTNIVLIVLDNSTTAMTGQQPHPGTGETMMGEISDKISIEKVLKAYGIENVITIDPLDHKAAVEAVKNSIKINGVSAIIFKSPCISISKPKKPLIVDTTKCIGCKKCITQLGCPAICLENGKAKIEESLCFGCSLCEQICPVSAIITGGDI